MNKISMTPRSLSEFICYQLSMTLYAFASIFAVGFLPFRDISTTVEDISIILFAVFALSGYAVMVIGYFKPYLIVNTANYTYESE